MPTLSPLHERPTLRETSPAARTAMAVHSRSAPMEAPAPGRWQISGVGSDPRRAAPRVVGYLQLGSTPTDSWLVLNAVMPQGRATPPVTLDLVARFAGVDERGDWQFAGTATVAGRSTPVTLGASYRGVFRRSERLTASFGLAVEIDWPGGSARRHRLRLRSTVQPRRLFSVAVNAERQAPTDE